MLGHFFLLVLSIFRGFVAAENAQKTLCSEGWKNRTALQEQAHMSLVVSVYVFFSILIFPTRAHDVWSFASVMAHRVCV